MNPTAIHTAIREGLAKIAPEADLDSLAPTDNFRESLGIDSYDFLRLLIGLSETLHIDIPEADYARLATLESMTRYLAESTA
jgi:acyl carrier protein